LGLGDNQRTRFIDGWRRPKGLGADVVQLEAGRDWLCARHQDGRVSCWGLANYGRSGSDELVLYQPQEMAAVSGATDIAVGTQAACYLNAQGEVHCWGRNRYGELGDNSKETRFTPVRVQGLGAVVAVDIEQYSACAVTQAGEVWCWGSAGSWRFGSADITGDQLVPLQIAGISGAVDVTVSNYGGCARLGSGEVLCWGSNWLGQSGLPWSSPHGPVSVSSLSAVSQVAMEGSLGCAITGDQGQLACWGANQMGQAGDPSAAAVDSGPRLIDGISGAIGLSVGLYHGCAWTSSGRRYCWGSNTFGQRGGTAPAQIPIREPQIVPGLEQTIQLVAGEHHFCTLDELGVMRCWGSNGYGQLGEGSTLASPVPVPASNLNGVAQVSAGNNFSCAVMNDGSAKCWGYNRNGQLGIGNIDNQLLPVTLNVPQLQTIRAGNSFACGLDTNGGMHCWGYGNDGVLGQGNRSSSRTPQAVPGLPAVQDFAVGYRHVCASTGSGSLYCWGRNGEGQTAQVRNNNPRVTTPTQVMISDVASLSLGLRHSCALTVNEGAWCWGYNNAAQLGNNSTATTHIPVRMSSLYNVSGIYAWKFGLGTSAVIDRQNGSQGFYNWGQGYWGQIGDGAFSTRRTPVLADVQGILGSGVRHVAANERQICVLGDNGRVACWGDPSHGRTGHGLVEANHFAASEVVAVSN
jgi:alpha-tubulin suppressor-like RCC1 family protein